MSEHTFCRLHLKEVMTDVRKHTTAEQRKAAWAWKSGQHVEFHGPEDEFHWHGRACCLWTAKAKGWTAWMEGSA